MFSRRSSLGASSRNGFPVATEFSSREGAFQTGNFARPCWPREVRAVHNSSKREPSPKMFRSVGVDVGRLGGTLRRLTPERAQLPFTRWIAR